MESAAETLRMRVDRYGARITDESFRGADLASVSGRHVWFTRVDLTDADLRHATLDAYFKDCTLVGTNFRGARLVGSDFAGCDLTGADLRDTDLREVRFGYVNTGADNGRTTLTGVRWDGADLVGTTFERVIGDHPQEV